MSSREQELERALRLAIGYIDAIPKEVELPAMPGFDRDWVDGLLSGTDENAAPQEEPVRKRQVSEDWVKDAPFSREDFDRRVDEICGCAGAFNCNCTSVFNRASSELWDEHNAPGATMK